MVVSVRSRSRRRSNPIRRGVIRRAAVVVIANEYDDENHDYGSKTMRRSL